MEWTNYQWIARIFRSHFNFLTSHSDENFLDWAITGTNLYYFLSAGVPIIKWFFVIFWEIFCKNYHQNSQEEQMLLFGIMTFSYWLVYILKAVHWTINALSIKFSTIVYLLLDYVILTLLGRGCWISPHSFQTSISPLKKVSGGPKFRDFS